MSRYRIPAAVSLIAFTGALLAGESSPPADKPSIASEDIRDNQPPKSIWKQIEWSGGVLLWPVPTGAQPLINERQVWWYDAENEQVWMMDGHIGQALIRLAEYVDITPLLNASPYLMQMWEMGLELPPDSIPEWSPADWVDWPI